MINGKLEIEIIIETIVKLMDSNIERLREKYKGKMKNKRGLLMGELVSIYHEHRWSTMTVHYGYLEIEPELNLHLRGGFTLFFCYHLVGEWNLSGNRKCKVAELPPKADMLAYEAKHNEIKRDINHIQAGHCH